MQQGVDGGVLPTFDRSWVGDRLIFAGLPGAASVIRYQVLAPGEITCTTAPLRPINPALWCDQAPGLFATLHSESTLTASLSVPLSASLDSTGSLAADLHVIHSEPTATIVGTSSTIGLLRVERRLAAATVSTGTMTLANA